MAAYCDVFNGTSEKYLFDKSDRKKIALPPHLSKHLLVNPSMFQSSCCIDEIRKANDMLNMKSADLIFFSVVIQRHWVLMCINVLHKKLNIFDSLKLTSEVDSERMLKNLASNFSKVCFEANISSEMYNQFGLSGACKYPQEHSLKETRRGLVLTVGTTGYYCIVYMDCWDGLKMRDFNENSVTEYRKIVAYKLYHSSLNKARSNLQELDDMKAPKKAKK